MWDIPWWVTLIVAWTTGSICLGFLLGKIMALGKRPPEAAKNIRGVDVKRGRQRADVSTDPDFHRQPCPQTRLGRARVFER